MYKTANVSLIYKNKVTETLINDFQQIFIVAIEIMNKINILVEYCCLVVLN